MSDLKLLALDDEDLQVISAHVQDAVLRVEDMGFVQSEKRFVALMNRFDWEAGAGRKKGQRKRSALHFDFVEKAEITGINTNAREGVVELLAISFTHTDMPAGEVLLSFAGGGTVRLQVECLEARLRDLGAAWSAKATPAHPEANEEK